MKPLEVVFFSVVAVCVTVALCVMIYFIHQDGAQKAKVDTACVNAGGVAGSVDLAGDGEPAKRGCIFN